MGLVVALHHVNVTVPADAEAEAKTFYGNLLGLEQLPKPSGTRPSGAWYQIGSNQLHLSVEKEGRSPLSTGHVCFAVSDLSAAENRFREAGIEIIPDPRPIEGTSRFYVRDPGGNLLEITRAVS